MDQRNSSTAQITFSRNALIITSIVLIGLGIIVLLAIMFGSNCKCGPSNQSFDRPEDNGDIDSDIQITKEEANNIAKDQDLATVEDINARNARSDTSNPSTVEDINRHRRREIESERGADTATATDVSVSEKTEDTTGETVTDDTSMESVVKSPQKKRKRNNAETSGSEWTDSSSRSSDFSSPTDKSH